MGLTDIYQIIGKVENFAKDVVSVDLDVDLTVGTALFKKRDTPLTPRDRNMIVYQPGKLADQTSVLLVFTEASGQLDDVLSNSKSKKEINISGKEVNNYDANLLRRLGGFESRFDHVMLVDSMRAPR